MKPMDLAKLSMVGTVWLASLAVPGEAQTRAEETCPASLAGQTIGFDLTDLAAARSALPTSADLQARKNDILRRADQALLRDPVSVTDKANAGPSGDKRDYVSLAPYWWPNPHSDDGLPYVRRDGQTNPERNGENFDRVRLQRMADDLMDLSLAAYITGDDAYAERAARQLKTWFVDTDTRMNPNLRYAQSIPGRNDGRAIGIIDSRIFADISDAAVLLNEMGVLDPATELAFREWIGAYAAWLLTSPFGLKERDARNNHGTFYDAQLAHFLVYGGRCDIARRILADTRMRAASQIARNGFQPLEVKRTRSLHYHGFNLEAFLRLARIGDMLDDPIYDSETRRSSSIREAVHKVAGYAGRTGDWPHPTLDDRGATTLTLTLLRARALDPEDEVVSEALRRAKDLSVSDPAPLLFYEPSDGS